MRKNGKMILQSILLEEDSDVRVWSSGRKTCQQGLPETIEENIITPDLEEVDIAVRELLVEMQPDTQIVIVYCDPENVQRLL